VASTQRMPCLVSTALEITANSPADFGLALMIRLLSRISANFSGGLGGVPGNARQITRLWLPDQGSNLGPAVTVHRGPPLFQRLKRKFVPQLAQTRRRETLYWRRASKLRNEFQRRFIPLLNVRHLTDEDNFPSTAQS